MCWSTGMSSRTWPAVLLVLLLTITTGTGCAGTAETAPSSSGCMPPPFSLSTDNVKAGGSLTVTASDTDCEPRYGDNAQIQLEIVDGSGAKILDVRAPMNDAGGFSTDVIVPESAVPGQGTVSAYPFNLDWCDDTGRNNRLNTPAGTGRKDLPLELPSEIQLASCAMRALPLTIER